MHDLGFADAAGDSGDERRRGDVVAARAVAQVKYHGKAIQRPAIQQLRGAALNHRAAVMYSWSGYSSGAVSYAEEAQVALFDVQNNRPVPMSSAAEELSRGSRSNPGTTGDQAGDSREAMLARQEANRTHAREAALEKERAEQAAAQSARRAEQAAARTGQAGRTSGGANGAPSRTSGSANGAPEATVSRCSTSASRDWSASSLSESSRPWPTGKH